MVEQKDMNYLFLQNYYFSTSPHLFYMGTVYFKQNYNFF